MIGGLKYTSRLAIVAAAGVMAGGVAAQAADLGGNCCADLEERVAELEATTARKGNRKVSLEVSGHVNEMMVFWSGDQDVNNDGIVDGNSSGFLVATNNSSRSRFRFKGSAKINADWSAGFLIEIGVRGTNNSQSNNFNSADLNEKSGLDVRHEALYLASKHFGTIWLGHTSSAADGITEICLGCTVGQGPDTGPYLGGFRPFGAGGQSWDQLASSTGGASFSGEGDRRDMISYATPSIFGFILSAAAGSDEFYDVALRYAGEFGGFRIAAGVGYQNSTEQTSSSTKGFAAGCRGTVVGNNETRVDCDAIGASASVMHVASGLYVAGSYGITRDNSPGSVEEDESWYVTAGINQKFFALGKTNIYGEYGLARREIGLGIAASDVNQREMEWFGVGITQDIDAAAMTLYVNYKHYEGCVSVAASCDTNVADLDLVALGAIIRF